MKEIRSDSRELMQLQANIQDVMRGIEAAVMVRGRLIENVTLSASANDVAHGLGRKLRGFVVARKNAAVDVWEPSVAAIPERAVRLQATGNVVVSLWVF